MDLVSDRSPVPSRLDLGSRGGAKPCPVGLVRRNKESMALDACFAVAVFFLGAACGALLTRIAYAGFEDRLRHGLAFDPLVENEDLNFQTAGFRNPAYSSGISLRSSERTCQSSHSKSLGE